MIRTIAAGVTAADRPNEDTRTRFTIGDLAREFDVTLRALRFYEDKGLLAPRREGSARIYSRRDRARLRLILIGKRLGFTLSEIREMIDLYDLKDGGAAQLSFVLGKLDEQMNLLQSRRDEIEEAIEELTRTRAVVSGMLDRPGEGRKKAG